MTDVMERATAKQARAGGHLDKNGAPCRASTHTTEWSFRNGCRSEAAVAAKSLDRQQAGGTLGINPKRRAKPILQPDPACGAEKHYASIRGYKNGCRCPGAVAARERNLEQMRFYGRLKAGTAIRDPREPWRVERMRCGRLDLFMLLHGAPQIDRATGLNVNTQTEKMVAVLRWTGKLRHPNGELYGDAEIGRLMGVSGNTVRRLREEPAARRATRTQRRLAEVQWKAMQAARRAVTAGIGGAS